MALRRQHVRDANRLRPYAYSLIVDKAICLNGGNALFMTDSANTGSSFPIWCYVYDIEGDHNYGNGVILDRGEVSIWSTLGWDRA